MNISHFAGKSASLPIRWRGVIAVMFAVLFPGILRAQVASSGTSPAPSATDSAKAAQEAVDRVNALVDRQHVQYQPNTGVLLLDEFMDASRNTISGKFSAPVAALESSTLGVGITPLNTYQLTVFCKGERQCATSTVSPPTGDGVSHPYSAISFRTAHDDGNKLLAALRSFFHAIEPNVVPFPKFASTFPPLPIGVDLSQLRLFHNAGAEDRSSSDQGAGNQATAAPSPAEWQQEHQANIDELTQEIANHEQQAEQDDANAEQAAAQVQQNASANVSGPGGGFLALGNAVEGAMNAGLAEKMRQDASEERRQAQEEREQLAELGAEQPPVAQNNSEMIALTRTQTQMIQSGNTIEGALNRAQNNMQAAQQAAAERREQIAEQQEAQRQALSARTTGSGMSAANVGAVPQGPPSGPVTVIFRGLLSPVPGQAVVTETLNKQSCPPDCSFSFPPGDYAVHFIAQANPQSIFRAFEGMCVGGGGTAPRTPGNSGACVLGSPPSQATTITVLVDPASPSDQTSTASASVGSGSPAGQGGATLSGATAPQTGGPNNSGSGQFTSPMASSCVRTFNDSSMYGWVALQNTCSQKMTVIFEGRSGNGGVSGLMDLAPGQSDNTGRSPDEIAAVGGIYTYACPYGYVPTDKNGHDVSAPVTEFTCKYRGY